VTAKWLEPRTLVDGHFRRQLVSSESALALGWFALSYHWVGDKEARRRKRNHLYRIESDFGKTLRTLRYAGNLEYNAEPPSGSIAIDYQGWLELQGLSIPELDTLHLRIRPASLWESLTAPIRHPDPTARQAGWIALVSLALGALSVLIALWAAFVRS
jgi:hypothetical protein